MPASEIVDVVDSQDNVIGTATRAECHRDSTLFHRCTHFTLYDSQNEQPLLTKRPHNKEGDAGMYMFAGEHVLTGETYLDALQRGVVEEFGFSPTSLKLIGKSFFQYDTQSEFAQMYLVDWHNEPLHWGQNDFETIQWVPKNSAELLTFNLGKITRFWVEKICT